MDFLCPSLPEQSHDLAAGGAPDDGVIDQDNPLSRYLIPDGAEFDFHLVYPLALAGGNKGAPDILVFDKAQAKGNAGLLRVADGGVQSRIGHTHNQVCLHGVALCQQTTGVFSCFMDADAVDDGVGAGKIDVFKNAAPLGPAAAMGSVGMNTGFVKGQDFSRKQIPLEFCAHSRQSAAFRSHNVKVFGGDAIAQGTEAVGIPGGNHLGRGHNHERKGTVQFVHGPADRHLDGSGLQSLLGDDVGDDLRIAGAVEDGASQLQGAAKLKGVAQVAVVGQGKLSFLMVDHNGLAVFPVVASGGAVAYVSDGHGSLGKPAQNLPGKNIINRP